MESLNKFDIQVHDVVMLIPVERKSRGKISLGKTNEDDQIPKLTRIRYFLPHPIGAQEYEKLMS
jgi:hypothetical protein